MRVVPRLTSVAELYDFMRGRLPCPLGVKEVGKDYVRCSAAPDSEDDAGEEGP
jgi:hypothetical protein